MTLSENHPILEMAGVDTLIDGQTVLKDINWTVAPGEHWVLIGPNGCGKSTLIAIAGLRRHPSAGQVTVLGHRLGRVDIRPLRDKIATSSANFASSLRPALTVLEVVICGASGALESWWHDEQPGEAERAKHLLGSVGLREYNDHRFGTLSSGEQQRCLLARTLMPEPALLLLDEPNAGLDLGGRESLISVLDNLATRPIPKAADGLYSHSSTKGAGQNKAIRPASVLVTHHVEDIPSSTTHVLALKDGKRIASGPIKEILTAELLSGLFGLEVELSQEFGRWSARSQRQP